MNRNEIKKWIIDNGFPNSRKISKRKEPEVYHSIMMHTEFLSDVPNATMSLRCYCILEDIYEVPTCSVCGKKCKKSSVTSSSSSSYHGFTEFCSRSCGNSARISRMKSTTKEKYGVENAMQSEEVKEKSKLTNERLNEKDPSRKNKIRKKAADTIKAKYGDDGLRCESIQEKKKRTSMDRYGVDFPMRSEEVKKKYKKSVYEKYKVDNISKIDDFRKKAESTNKIRYGDPVFFKTDDFCKKSKITNRNKYGVDYYVQSEEFLNKASISNRSKYGKSNFSQTHLDDEIIDILSSKEMMKLMYEEHKFVGKVASILGVDKNTVSRRLKSHGIEVHQITSSSIKEEEIYNFISSIFDGEIERSNSNEIYPKHLDIYIPSLKLAFEFNGVYWHSSKFKDRMYHQNKSLACRERGIRLIHIWEDDWDNKKEVVKRMILTSLGICSGDIIEEKDSFYNGCIDYEDSEYFLDKNIIQGSIDSGIRVGLIERKTNSLVACAVFIEKEEEEFELARYAASKNVVGGLSKIIRNFRKERNVKRIISFVSLDVGDEDLYKKSGFSEIDITSPCLWYVDTSTSKRMTKYEFINQTLDGMADEDNVMRCGGLLLYDSGMIKYEMD